jgi:hypothetical protein
MSWAWVADGARVATKVPMPVIRSMLYRKIHN